MVVRENKPVTMAEVSSLVGDSDKSGLIKDFIKNFDILSVEKSMELVEELKKLDLIKLKDLYIVKIVDFMPGDAAELNKVVSGVSFDQEEITKILDVVGKY
jgi:DNA-directed RNA polymerase subunit F